MKIRITGTKEECQAAAEIYTAMMGNPNIKSLEISSLYPNRAPSNLYRIYIDIGYINQKAIPKLY